MDSTKMIIDVEKLLNDLQSGLDEFDGCELNMSNYNHEDVRSLNNAYVGLFQTIENAMDYLSVHKKTNKCIDCGADMIEVCSGSQKDDIGCQYHNFVPDGFVLIEKDIVEQSKQNFERQFGKCPTADWVYFDIQDLITSKGK